MTRPGVLLIHGLTDSPAALEPWAEHMRDSGFRVETPLLPGHGSTLAQLRRTRWTDWVRAAEQALTELLDDCDSVVVGGHSLGGALALELAAQESTRVTSVLLVNPSVDHPSPFIPYLGLLKYLVPALPNRGLVSKPDAPVTYYPWMPLGSIQQMSRLWRHLHPRLPSVHQPVLMLRSTADGAAGEFSAQRVRDGVSSRILREVPMENSFHLAVLDHDADLICEESVAFLKTHQGTP